MTADDQALQGQHPGASTGETPPGMLLVIDGHALAYRALHATPAELTSPEGEPTGAIHGFLSMLLGLIGQRRPDGLVVCFDAGRDLRRTAIYPGYKATRLEAPPTLRPQVEQIQKILRAAGIPVVVVPGVEADDCIATVAALAVERGWHVEVATGDRDALQLVSGQVTVLSPGRSMRELVVMDPPAVRDRYGVPPERYVELAALRGDVSDNLSGVAGVGPKTAAELVSRFASVDDLYAGLDQLRPRLAAALDAARGAVERNLTVMRLLCDVDLGVPAEQIVRRWDPEGAASAAALCRRLGLEQVASRLVRLSGHPSAT